MDDLISRQAAIDAIKGLPTWWADGGGYYGGAQPPMEALLEPNDVISAIDNLPSAQQWTLCEKKLPEEGQCVRISVHGRAFDAVYEGLSSDHVPVWVSHGCVYWADEVSRWMPLPDCYQGDENNEM